MLSLLWVTIKQKMKLYGQMLLSRRKRRLLQPGTFWLQARMLPGLRTKMQMHILECRITGSRKRMAVLCLKRYMLWQRMARHRNNPQEAKTAA